MGVQSEPLVPCGPTEDDLEWLGESGWRVVPRRVEILHSSWIFVWASAALLAQFILLKQGWEDEPVGSAEFFRKISLVNAVGLVSCIFWLHGFFMLVHWLVSIGGSRGAILGALTKTVASAFFNVQPLGALCGYGTNSAGADWGNLVGICFFHGGNMISFFDMVVLSRGKPGGMNYGNVLSWGNVPVLAVFFYTIGSGLLVAANAWGYESTPGSKGYHPSYAPGSHTIQGFQISGATSLLIGSLIFCHWAAWVPRCGKRPAKLNNDYWASVEATS